MAGRDIIVVGASSGGVDALSRLVASLPPGLPAALFVVLHVPAGAPSYLPDILAREGRFACGHARDGEPVEHGRVYVAPPDFHMLLRPGQVRVVRGPRENHSRPAIDPLFRSAARAYGPRVVGVVLTGELYDGTAGLMAVRAAGGVAVVQDPADAVSDVMPRTALNIAGADWLLPLAAISATLAELAITPAGEKGGEPMADNNGKGQEIVDRAVAAQEAGARNGEASVLTCPECGGTLFQMEGEKLVQFRCHVGHAYYAETLLAEQSEALEAALWTAVRMFKEKAILARQLAAQAERTGQARLVERYQDQAAVAGRYADSIQDYILKGAGAPPTNAPPEAAERAP